MSPADSARAKLACGAALTIPEAAALLGVAVATVRGWRLRQIQGRGDVPALDFRRYGGCVRITAASVRALQEAR